MTTFFYGKGDNMKTIFISQPMKGLTIENVQANRKRVERLLKPNYIIADSIFTDFDNITVKNKPLYCLSKAIAVLSECDVIYMMKGWELARGCRIEHECAKEYGLNIIYE